MRRKILGLLAAVVLGFSVQAQAGMIAVGPVEIGSWGQLWDVTTTGSPYDHIQMFLLGGGPTWTVTEADANWSITSQNDTMTILDGPAGINQLFSLTTSGVGNVEQALFLTQKWQTVGVGAPVLQREYLIGNYGVGGAGWNPVPNSAWYLKVVQSGEEYRATVPDGGTTLALLGAALAGIAALRRRLGA